MKQFLLILFASLISQTQLLADEGQVFYLIGEVEKTEHSDLYFKELKKKLLEEKATLVFLGNYSGMIEYNLETDELNYQSQIPDFFLDFIEEQKIETYMLPGNQEWENGKRTGQDVVNEIEKVYKKRLKKHVKFIPDDAQPGPIVKELNENTILIFVNTQFWLQQEVDISRISHDFDDVGNHSELQKTAFIYLSDLLKKYSDKNIIMFGHHPAVNNGFHGGHFGVKEHLFPLAGDGSFYLPLPGFLYYGPRKWLGAPQDLNHPEYKQMADGIKQLAAYLPNLLYISGHENNFQFNKLGMGKQLIVGSVAKPYKNKQLEVTEAGITRMELKDGNQAIIEFLSLKNQKLETIASKEFNFKLNPLLKLFNQKKKITDSTIKAIPSKQYEQSKFIRSIMGENYREVWATESEFPVFDISKEKGGLKILKRGGGQQTQSYRLQNKDKKQYVLRSVEKNASGALPASLKGTIAVSAIQDAISASHPYGAVVVPKLAEAAGIYHTNPQIVFVPNDPALGIYQLEMKNKLFLYEERPAKNRDDIASFGYSKDIISTPDVLETIIQDDDAEIDQKFVLRSRLFDMWIADWDRHDDQWRWASFEKDDKTIFRPIPRDRDNAFFNSDGSLFKIAELTWVQPKFQGFKPNTRNIEGFNYNGRYFDRTFMNKLTLKDWQEIAADLQNKLTDELIDQTVDSSLPKKVNELSGDRIKKVLKQRRENLADFAEDYHRFISKNVDITGTEDEDLFKIWRYNDSTHVDVFSVSEKKERIKNHLYSRTFDNNNTKEIRLYGLDDEDQFEIAGEANEGIKLRLIGGKGKDKYTDESKIRGASKKTIIYDRFGKNKITKSSETGLRLRNSKEVYEYNRKQFKYNTTMPLLAFGYNVDDGVLLGGGFLNQRYHFRDSTMHMFIGKKSFQTSAFQAKYKMYTTSIWRNFDFFLDAEVSMPFTTDNFFGYGNETENFLEHKKDYRIRYRIIDIAPSLAWLHTKNLSLKTGVRFIHTDLELTDDHKLFPINSSTFPPEVPTDLFDKHQYVSAFLAFEYKNMTNKLFPSRGISFNTEISRFNSLNEFENFTQAEGHFATYLSFRKDPRMVIALRAGGLKNFGDYPLYEAARLGRKTNLRGFRSSRFAGDAMAYQNTDLRLKIKNVNSYIFSGSLGLIAFHDIGRVWFDGQDSNKWHQGYGAGVWFSPFNFTNLSMLYELSEEENLVTINFNFLF